MKGTKSQKKATITLCLSFPNKAMNFATLVVISRKNNQNKFFWPIEIKKLNEYYG